VRALVRRGLEAEQDHQSKEARGQRPRP
jgi:hypothetical protein